MKKLVSFVALASLFAAPTLAQVPDPGPDSYGIYFETDEGDFVNQLNDVPPSSVVPTYVILAGITEPQVDGWEVAFAFTAGTGEVIDTEYLGDALNFALVPFFTVGLGGPLYVPTEGYLVLATMNVLFYGGVQDWYGGPPETPMFPNRPAYISTDLMNMVPCYFSTDADGEHLDEDGWTTWPVASINGEAPVATENASWSNLKNMYR